MVRKSGESCSVTVGHAVYPIPGSSPAGAPIFTAGKHPGQREAGIFPKELCFLFGLEFWEHDDDFARPCLVMSLPPNGSEMHLWELN